MRNKCTLCDKEIESERVICKSCAIKNQEVLFPQCPICHKNYFKGAAFCLHCGSELIKQSNNEQIAALLDSNINIISNVKNICDFFKIEKKILDNGSENSSFISFYEKEANKVKAVEDQVGIVAQEDLNNDFVSLVYRYLNAKMKEKKHYQYLDQDDWWIKYCWKVLLYIIIIIIAICIGILFF